MRRLKFQLDRKSLQAVYFSVVRQIMEYADIVWTGQIYVPKSGYFTLVFVSYFKIHFMYCKIIQVNQN